MESHFKVASGVPPDNSMRQKETHQKHNYHCQADNYCSTQKVKPGLRCVIPGEYRSQEMVKAASV
jgi:hypothetical protein